MLGPKNPGTLFSVAANPVPTSTYRWPVGRWTTMVGMARHVNTTVLGVEPPEPLGDEGKALLLESVDAGAALLFLAEQASLLEDAQVAGGGWPFVLEAAGDLPGGRDPAAEVEREEDLPAGGVREGRN